MTLWRTYPGTRTPLPYLAQRQEQRLMLDLHSIWCGDGNPVGDEAFKERSWASAINHPWSGSNNWTNLALGVQSSRGVTRLPRWHRHLVDCETKGHNLAEWCSINYNDRTVLGRACTVAGVEDTGHPAAELLRRDLLLFAILARPIVARAANGRVLYEGYGWRRAGLRSTANHWGTWLDSYLMARILGLDAEVTKHGRRQEREWCELVDAVAGRLSDGVGLPTVGGLWLELSSLHSLAKGQPLYVGIEDETVLPIAAPLRTPPGMSAILARDTVTGETFSCLLGTRIGSNTGATWAAHAKGPELEDVTWCYPWRDAKGKPVKRVRTGKLKRAGAVMADTRVRPDRLVVFGEKALGAVWDEIHVPFFWLYDDTRAIRLEVDDAAMAKLNLPGGARD